jgi:L-asparagine oxygenase
MTTLSIPQSTKTIQISDLITEDSNDQAWKVQLGKKFRSLNNLSKMEQFEFLSTYVPKIVKDIVPSEILKKLASIKDISAIPYQIINDLPVDSELIGVPKNGKRPSWKKTYVSEAVLIGMAKAIELQPIAYFQEKEGILIHEIVPIPGKEEELSNAGKVSLGFHTDHAILPSIYRPDYLMLMGLVNEDRVPTRIACLDDALEKLPKETEELLRQPLFRIESPDSVLFNNGIKMMSGWRPLLSTGFNGQTEFAGNLYSVRFMNTEAKEAVCIFEEILAKVTKEVVLDPGTLILFDNKRTLHGRPSVKKGDRWLQRLFCSRSLQALREANASVAPSSYIFDIQKLLLN